MRARLLTRTVCAVGVSVALMLSGCFGIPDDPLVAAVVNDTVIYEDDITEYIEGFRSKNQEYETDSAWAEFLNSNGKTAESMRRYVLDENFIPREVIRQECASRSITLTDEALDDVIEQEKAYYEERYGENSWESVLSSYGYDEKSWRQNESDRLLEERLRDTVIKTTNVTAAELQRQVDSHASDYNGKHSYYATYATQEEAAEARDKRVSKSGKISVKRFKRAHRRAGVYNAGWNSLSSDRRDMSQDYVNALDSLEEGHVSEPVAVGDQWVIILCNKVYSCPESVDSVDVSTVPEKILRQLRADALSVKINSEFEEWVDKQVEESDIVVEAMPEGLPYDVNVTVNDE